MNSAITGGIRPSMSGFICTMLFASSERTSSSGQMPSRATKSVTSSHDRDSACNWNLLDLGGSSSPRNAAILARMACLSSLRIRQQSRQNRYVQEMGLKNTTRAIVPFVPHLSHDASVSRGDEPLLSGKHQLLIRGGANDCPTGRCELDSVTPPTGHLAKLIK